MGIKWIVFEAIRNSCIIRYKTLGWAWRFTSDKALMLEF